MSAMNNSPQSGAVSPSQRSWRGLPDQSQLDFEIEFFDKVLQRAPDYLDVLRCQGQLLSRKGLHARALEVDRRLVQLDPQDAVAHYNLGCSLALMGYSKEALQALRQALQQGYNDVDFLESDRDLDSLRDHPEYQELLKEFGAQKR